MKPHCCVVGQYFVFFCVILLYIVHWSVDPKGRDMPELRPETGRVLDINEQSHIHTQ